ncbi:hypothetical protein QUF56_08195 [Ureibacillus composti]|nr:hypothetical protein [Ureibacillus composti]
MENLRNNQGYTLFFVLMIISVFTILALSFTVQSTNSAKQNTIVEAKMQSVDLAEMGSQFYMNAIKNEFNEAKEVARNAQNDYLNSVDQVITDEILLVAQKKGITAAYDFLERKLSNSNTGLPRSKSIGTESSSPKFEIGFDKNSNGNEILLSSLVDNVATITFYSTGIESGTKESNDTTVKANLEIDFGQMINSSSNAFTDNTISYNNGSNSNTLQAVPLIQDPDPNNNLPTCENDTSSFINKKCQFIGDKNFPENEPTFTNSTVKVIGNLSFDKKFDFNGGLLYVTGDFLDPKGSNISLSGGINNSIGEIFIGGNANFGNLNNSKNMKIVVGKDATFKNNINGNATNVTICIYGNLVGINNYKDDSVKIYVKSEDSEAFDINGACAGGTSNSGGKNPSWTWDVPYIIKEDYNYNITSN